MSCITYQNLKECIVIASYLIHIQESHILTFGKTISVHKTLWKPHEPMVWWIEHTTFEFMSCPRSISPPLEYPKRVVIASLNKNYRNNFIFVFYERKINTCIYTHVGMR